MKPRIKLWMSCWHCWLRGTHFNTFCGLGATPKDAYEDWMRLMTKGPTNATV